MGLFRSEEHAKNWVDYDPTSSDATMPLTHWAQALTTPSCRTRLETDTLTRQMAYGGELLGVLADFGRTGTRWDG